MADFRARIETFADISQASNTINSFVSQARKLRIDVDLNVTSANQAISSMLSNLQSQARSAGNSAGSQFANTFSSALNNIRVKGWNSNAIQNMFANAGFDAKSIDTATKELDKMSIAVKKISTTQLANGNLRMNIEGIEQTEDGLKRTVKVVNEFKQKTGEMKTVSKTFSQSFGESFKQVNTSVSQAQQSVQKFNQIQAQTFGNQMTTWARNNTKAVREYGNELQTLHERLQTAIANKDGAAVKQIKDEFRLLQSEARATGNVGKTLTESFASSLGTVSRFVASYISIYRIFNELKEGVKTVVELDNALVDLQKTSTATPAQLNSFYREANDIAKQYGATTKEIIQGAADWSRLGYNLEDSQTMSKLSSQFAAISPGMSVDQATTGLVSTMKAFGIEADNVLDGIMSKVNAVGNGFALANSDIIDALQNSSSAMAVANNSLDETIALITAGTEVTQQASKVGNGLRTISMRIRGMNEETEELDDSLVNIKGDVAELTGGKVSIMEDADTYKSTYQILKEISAVWDELSDKNQAELCLYVQKCA